jgi:hypothetical protein
MTCLGGRATTQALSHLSLTAEVGVCAQFSQCGACGGQSDIRKVFPTPPAFACQYRSTAAPYSPCINWGLVSVPASDRSSVQTVSQHRNTNNNTICTNLNTT